MSAYPRTEKTHALRMESPLAGALAQRERNHRFLVQMLVCAEIVAVAAVTLGTYYGLDWLADIAAQWAVR